VPNADYRETCGGHRCHVGHYSMEGAGARRRGR
jgi:hypothetical protein